jgi:hypothetical protein
MIKALSCCVVFLAATQIGQVAAQSSDQVTDLMRPGMLSDARYADHSVVFLESESARKAIEPAALAAIASWLSQHFGLPNTSDLPRVEFVTPEHLAAMRYRVLLPHRPQSAAHQQQMLEAERDSAAIYDGATRTVYLSDGWRGESHAEVSILVHEMVHHLQYQAQLKFECLQEREEMAYKAQDRWLAQVGLSLATEFGIDPFTRLVRTRCMG